MFNKLTKNIVYKISLVSAAVLAFAAFTGSAAAAAVVDPLVVEFEQTPLFSEVNFLPGNIVPRWVKVTNNSGQTQGIITEAINSSDPNKLGDKLNLEIKEGGVSRYNDTLSDFFKAGNVFLSELGSGVQTQYDFIVTFDSGSEDAFQGKSLGFDILIGFEGDAGGSFSVTSGDGGGGGGGGGTGYYLPPGLTILGESVATTGISEESVTIYWTTSYLSTSQVIYAKEGESHTLDLTDNTGTPPKYGYARTTPETDISPKVTSHSVTIAGLTPGTKYYFRSISHGSLAISQEYSFTTTGGGYAAGGDNVAGAGGGVAQPLALANVPAQEEVVAPAAETLGAPVLPTPIATPIVVPTSLLMASLANILNLGGSNNLIGFVTLFIILFLLAYGIYQWVEKRREKRGGQEPITGQS